MSRSVTSSIIKSHNKIILSKGESKLSKSSCICRDKTSCHLNGNYLQQNMIYYSKVISRNECTNKNHPYYIRLTEGSFEDILYKHKKCLNGRANKIQQNYQISYGIRRRKTLTYHSNGVY